jgi:hypothetical protein
VGEPCLIAGDLLETVARAYKALQERHPR